MKSINNLIRLFVFFLIISFLIVPCSVKQSFAGSYLGEFCWKSVDASDTDGDYSIGKFAVNDVGGGHFSLYGSFTSYEENSSGNVLPAHGNAELIGNKIIATIVMTFSEAEEYFGSGTIEFQIDATTLDGTFRSIINESEKPFNTVETFYEEGTLEFLPNCKR